MKEAYKLGVPFGKQALSVSGSYDDLLKAAIESSGVAIVFDDEHPGVAKKRVESFTEGFSDGYEAELSWQGELQWEFDKNVRGEGNWSED